jgi:hypothetical protein
MFRNDMELLERELRAAKSAVDDFCKRAAAVKVSVFDKTANVLFGKKGDPDASDIARDGSRNVFEYYRGVLFNMNTPTSFFAVENDLTYLAEQLHLAEKERHELEPDNVAKEAKKSVTPGFPFGSKASADDSVFAALADFGGDRANPVGPYAMIALLDQLASLKILKIAALSKSLSAKRTEFVEELYKEAASWTEHKLLLEIEKREAAARTIPRGQRTLRLKLFTVSDYALTIDQEEDRLFGDAVASELRSIAYQKGNKSFLRKQSTEETAATKRKEQAISDFVAGLAPSKDLPPEDRVPEHVDRVTGAIKEKLRMTQARDEMLKQYPAEYHWYIKKQFRTALEELN